MQTDPLGNDLQYQRLECERTVPIPVSIIRGYIDAHDSVTDTEIIELARIACDLAEERTMRSIFWSQWELKHRRGDIILPRAPIREVKQVQIKNGRKWVDVDLKNEEAFEQYWQNNESRYIKIKQWQPGQQIKVTYMAGYKEEDYILGNIPASIYKYILNLCVSEYLKEPLSKEIQSEQKFMLNRFEGLNIW